MNEKFGKSGGRGRPSAGGGAGRGDGPRKPYGERKPYAPRGEGGRDFGGERKPYAPRDGGPRDGAPWERSAAAYERKPYGERSERPQRDFGGERKPYAPREGGRDGGRDFGGERKPHGDRPQRDFSERKPYAPRGERPERGPERGQERGFKRDGGSFAPRGPRVEASWEADERAPRKKNSKTVEFAHPQADGWLIGPHAVLAALTANRRALRELWVAGEPNVAIKAALELHPEVVVLQKDKAAFDSEFGDWVHQNIALQVGNLPQPHLQDVLDAKPALLVALDEVTDPHNIGAILRSCAAFNVGGVIMPERRSGHVTPVVAKAAAGGLELVPVLEVVNLVQTLKMAQNAGYTVVGLAGEGAVSLSGYVPSGPTVVVMGSEGDGLRRLTRETCDTLLRIEQHGQMESLNVSVAAGITLSHLFGKLGI